MLRPMITRVFIAAALLSGCTCGKASGDGDLRVTRAFPAFDPATVDFGFIRIGDAPVTKSTVLWNNGGAGALVVSSARIENDTRSAYRLVSSAPTGDADSVSYVLEHRASPTAGTDTATVVARVRSLGESRDVHGILVQLPLALPAESQAALEAVPPEKDVDGLTERSMGRLVRGQTGHVDLLQTGAVHRTVLDRQLDNISRRHLRDLAVVQIFVTLVFDRDGKK